VKVLVTGATGVYGANMAKNLIHNGHEVVSIIHDIHPISTASLLKIENSITWVHGDVLEYNFLKRIMADYEIDMIYHFAAMPIVKRCPDAPLPVYQTNIIGTCNILEVARTARHRDVAVLFMSTDKAYGYTGNKPYEEDLPLLGLGVYDSSKASADLITRAYNYTYGLKTVVARSCNVYGPGDLNWRIIPNTIRRCLEKKPPIIFKGIKHIREYIFIEDAVDALAFLIDRIDKVSGKAFNIGSGESFSDQEIIEKIAKFFPSLKAITRDPLPHMCKEIPYQKLSSTKINKLGWKPKTNFDTGLKKTIEWYKQYKAALPASPLK
jgi:CDP-glucose 4,6-dehydratase